MTRSHLFRSLCLLALGSTALAKPLLPTPADFPILGELEPLLVKEIYDSKDRGASLSVIAKNPDYLALLKKHKLTLLGGPALGQLSPSSVSVWFRTAQPADVTIILADGTNFGPAQTTFDSDLIGTISLTGLKPDSCYAYQILVDGKPASPTPKSLTFRTAPEADFKGKFTVAFGACSRYVPEREDIWKVVAAQNPIAYLTLGDNLYIDQPKEQQKQRVHYYRRQFHPAYRSLTATTPIYSIWDDHDFAANDDEGGPERFKPSWKVKNFEVYAQNWNNPPYAGGKENPGTFFDFVIGDVHFIMTDGRYYRHRESKSMLGDFQKEWLKETLSTSKSKFKVLCSGTLWTEHADKGGKDSWEGYAAERDDIFSLIRDQKIGGVFLLSGDRHRHEMFKLGFDVGYPLYEFETAKVTNIHTHDANPHSLFSYNAGNFFGLLDFDFTSDNPAVTYRCVTQEGKKPEHLTFSMTLQDLTPN
ncbi:alkaline phosphatase D family protein [Akkermansiaceae bacterium]|nr:alkaline phosphatase D family protein [Akkermansiaceae bacterium]